MVATYTAASGAGSYPSLVPIDLNCSRCIGRRTLDFESIGGWWLAVPVVLRAPRLSIRIYRDGKSFSLNPTGHGGKFLLVDSNFFFTWIL